MKRTKRINIFIGIALIALLMTMCMTITEVIQPESAAVNEEIEITVKVDMKPEQNNNNYFVFGVLVPKSWNIKGNATASFDSPYDFGDGFPVKGPMRIAGDDFIAFPQDEAKDVNGQKNGETWSSEVEKNVGIGANYADVEWVVFISENKCKVRENENFSGTVSLKLKVGDGHTKAQLGYFVGNANHGLKIENPPRDDGKGKKHYDYIFTDCMTITGAANDATDLCGPPPSSTVKIAPDNFLFDDIITIRFDAKEGLDGANTSLYNASEVYVCATAHLTDGSTITVCGNNDKSKMTLVGNNIWELTIWPTGYFNVPAGNMITHLELNFQNSDGSIVVKHPNFGIDFQTFPTCE